MLHGLIMISRVEIRTLVHKDHNQQEAKRIFAKQSAPQDLFTVTVLLFLQAGSGQNFLFLYRGSWLVAADPLSNSLTYRMFQRSGAARTPDTRADTWHVVNNDGTISQTSQARVPQRYYSSLSFIHYQSIPL